MNHLELLRRREIAATIALAAWALAVLSIAADFFGPGQALGFVVGYLSTVIWVALDARWRGLDSFGWGIFTFFAAPIALPIYLLKRPAKPAVCAQCGRELSDPMQPCFACGHQSPIGRFVAMVKRLASSLSLSLAAGPTERTRHTAKHMAIALGAVVGFGLLFHPGGWFIRLVWALSAAAYWVLVPWWIYLDATWRKMDAIPWALLALVTNLFGLVTYLVIRYPDPRTCPQCGANLNIGLKHCPYCGSQTETTCPRCQASVRTEWIYCPACASPLPAGQTRDPEPGAPRPSTASRLSITGLVTDARTGAPLAHATVQTDSRRDPRITQTDAAGRYLLPNLDPRPHVLLATAQGYRPQAKPYTPGTTGPTQVHFSLQTESGETL